MQEKMINDELTQEILDLIRSKKDPEIIKEKLNDYHENDIASAVEVLEPEERKWLLQILGAERMSEIVSYIDDVTDYIEELGIEQFADLVEQMDADDAVDVLEGVDEPTREQIIAHMESDAQDDIQLIQSYDDDMIGSQMTTNYIVIKNTCTIKQAMRSMIVQAEKNDNINTIYVEDNEKKYCGAIELKDLITAREHTPLDSLIITSYPYVYANESISECIESIRDYEEDSIPVLDSNNQVIGVITSTDIVELVNNEMGDDYAKLAGLTEQSDVNESVRESMKKRLPWLVLLLFLGIGVSSVVGIFEGIVSQIALIVCFQSLILDMAGNVGTQSLAVTIRVLMDEGVSTKQMIMFIWKEIRIGFNNGLLLGGLSCLFIGMYIYIAKHKSIIYAFSISGCVGISLLVAMVISSLVGTIIPIFFHKIKVDPAVASGPLITTVNDLVAVVTYYGLAGLLLINVLNITR